MITLYVTNIALAAVCLWLLVRAHRADIRAKIATELWEHSVTIARIAKEDADATFELWCNAANECQRLRVQVKWLQRSEESRQRRSMDSQYTAPFIVMPVSVPGLGE